MYLGMDQEMCQASSLKKTELVWKSVCIYAGAVFFRPLDVLHCSFVRPFVSVQFPRSFVHSCCFDGRALVRSCFPIIAASFGWFTSPFVRSFVRSVSFVRLFVRSVSFVRPFVAFRLFSFVPKRLSIWDVETPSHKISRKKAVKSRIPCKTCCRNVRHKDFPVVSVR